MLLSSLLICCTGNRMPRTHRHCVAVIQNDIPIHIAYAFHIIRNTATELEDGDVFLFRMEYAKLAAAAAAAVTVRQQITMLARKIQRKIMRRND